MIQPKFFYDTLSSYGINFFAGVPDSLLKNLCAYITDHADDSHNIIAANEGGAMGLAAGHYLATGQIPVVYMQNSGEGNIINPLASLTDPDVYNIPVLLVIGWRGKPGVHDEPQHVKQGKITTDLLSVMGVDFSVLSKDEETAAEQIKKAVAYMRDTKQCYALVIEKDTFDSYQLSKSDSQAGLSLSREEAIQTVAAALGEKDAIVSTTGMISRELFEYRTAMNQGHERDFLTVGSMGHASQIALGIALEKPDRGVWCFDGDGAAIMHMGSMAIVAQKSPKNYVHVVFNNGAHDSVGGQPTVGLKINIPAIAKAVGYKHAFSVETKDDLLKQLAKVRLLLVNDEGPIFLQVCVKKGNRKDLGRPTTTPIQNKEALMDFLKKISMQQIVDGIGTLQTVLAGSKKIFLVCGHSFSSLSIKNDFENVHIPYVKFDSFTPNPSYDEVCNGIDVFNAENCDTIVAIGGGSCMDVAKCIKLFCRMSKDKPYLEQEYSDTGIPLIAIPTTAGSGSESTRFAVIYYEGKKQSVTHESIIPNVAILEPSVLKPLPLYQKKCTLMDALCQGIEAWWSVNSTDGSKRLSKQAVETIMHWWREYIFENSDESAKHIMQAANLAGQAICITQTTAAHAFSYKITSLYNIPHGYAVAVCLPKIWRYMAANLNKCVDTRGENYVEQIFTDIATAMGFENVPAAIDGFEHILTEMALVNPTSDTRRRSAEIEVLSTSVNPIRLKNNPIELDNDAIRSLYEQIIL